MRAIRQLQIGIVLAGALALSAAVAPPNALRAVEGGAWAVSPSSRGADSVSVCVSDSAQLMQWEHRGEQCRATILSQTRDSAVVDYTCRGADFGRSQLTMITPRTFRLESQGIHRGGPFAFKLYGQRLGSCAR